MSGLLSDQWGQHAQWVPQSVDDDAVIIGRWRTDGLAANHSECILAMHDIDRVALTPERERQRSDIDGVTPHVERGVEGCHHAESHYRAPARSRLCNVSAAAFDQENWTARASAR